MQNVRAKDWDRKIAPATSRRTDASAALHCALRLFFGALVFAVALTCAFLLVFASRPALAREASEYTMPQVNIDATVSSDGSLHVVEERTFVFSKGNSVAWFSLDRPYGGTLRVNGVWIGDSNDVDMNGNVISTPLQRVPFNQDWRESGGPDVSSYAVDMPRNTVYVFFSSGDEERTITLDYTVENALGVYRDVGELYWSYQTSYWDVASQNVTLNVHLPVPADAQVTPGETVRAWGHGPQDGAVAINADGSVTCTCPLVRSGQYAAVRVVFPSTWLSDVPLKIRQKHQTETRLETVVAEEAAWSDTGSAQHETWLTFQGGLAAVSALLLAAAALLWACMGRERRPRWSGEPSPDALGAEVHPAVVGRLWRLDRDSARDMTACAMRLLCAGNIGLERQAAKDGAEATCDRFALVRRRRAPVEGLEADAEVKLDDVADVLDVELMRLLFDKLAGGSDRLAFDVIPRVAAERPSDFLAWTNAWQAALSTKVGEQGLFDARSMSLQLPVVGVGLAWAALGLAAWYFFHDSIYAWMMVPAGLLVALFGANMPRRAQAGVDLTARCEALLAWMQAQRGDKEDAAKADVAKEGASVEGALSGVMPTGRASNGAMSDNRAAEDDSRQNGLAAYAYVLGADSPEPADALTEAFDEGWHAARDALRGKVRARHQRRRSFADKLRHCARRASGNSRPGDGQRSDDGPSPSVDESA